MRILPLSCFLLGLAVAQPAWAAEGPAPQGREPRQSQDGRQGQEGQGGLLGMLPANSVTRHTLSVSGRTLSYTAEAGTLPLRDAKAETTAAVFFVSYTLDPVAADRPITFVFNGGPGAASAYLHLGGIGPRAVDLAPDGDFLPPPQRLVDNPQTWLDMTDLVFVDPVGTGYSRGADSNKEDQFWGVEQDANAMSAFIRLYLQRSGRRLSPVYLMGESYGGFRAALLSRRLQADSGVEVSGAILISPALEFSLIQGDDFEPLRWALRLPSMAAVNYDRQGVTGRAGLAEHLKDVETYAMERYLPAIAGGLESGGKLVSADVARLTGLPRDFVERRFGRVSTSAFMKEFDRSDGRILSRYDGMISGPDPNPESPLHSGPDPVLDRAGPVLTSAFVQYVREELGFRTDITYRVLNEEVNRRWDFGTTPTRQGYAGVLGDLQQARAGNPGMRILIAHGYTDLATPYMASRFLISQLAPLAGAPPVRVEVYSGGHMMYMRADSRRALKEDAAAIYEREG
jgi:carboxypeptidase C (cathepsin A)